MGTGHYLVANDIEPKHVSCGRSAVLQFLPYLKFWRREHQSLRKWAVQ